jgi:hypothetical protein
VSLVHAPHAAMTVENPTFERLAMALTENGGHAAVRIIFQMSTDDELLNAYEMTDRRSGNPVADLLLVELNRRELDR